VTAIVIIVCVMVAGLSIAVILEQHPERQVVTYAVYGLVLALLFFVLQAPDVALSEVAVGAVVVPLVILTTLAKTRGKS